MGFIACGKKMEKSVSFRTHLLSNTLDLISQAGLDCGRTAKLIVSLVSDLAAYAEEGASLSPTVYICGSVTTLIAQAGSGEHVLLSNKIPVASAGSKVLKAAAPLCSGNWSIFVERLDEGEACRFGVFYCSSDPSALTVDEAVLNDSDLSFPIIRIAQNVTNKVEVRTSTGAAIEFRFNGDDDSPNVGNSAKIESLSSHASIVEGGNDAFKGLMKRLLNFSIKKSHGCLIAVLIEGSSSIPLELSDCITLQEPIDLMLRHSLHVDEGRTAISVGRLQAAFELVAGFINSDGITIFTADGKVLGYRAFVKNDSSASAIGGARTRAYQALSSLVGTSLQAAFFRSQDGRMEIKVRDKGGSNA